jgi:DNA-binding CsgD family transcriptional regulator
MRPGKRFGLSAIEKSDIWCRWKAGQSLHEIGRAFDKPHSSIRCLLLPRGGIPPAARRRSHLALTLAEREDISRGIASGSPLREIARRLDRAASTVSREISRNGGRPAYRAHTADDHAWDSTLRPKQCLLAVSDKLRNIVASKLILNWSPEQISGWLKIEYPDDQSMHVSHETIYCSLFIQAREVLKKNSWTICARSGACAVRDTSASLDIHEDRASMPSPFANDLRKKTERFLVIGKAIC